MQEDEETGVVEEEEEAQQRPALAFFGGRGQQGPATQAERSFKAPQPSPFPTAAALGQPPHLSARPVPPPGSTGDSD